MWEFTEIQSEYEPSVFCLGLRKPWRGGMPTAPRGHTFHLNKNLLQTQREGHFKKHE